MNKKRIILITLFLMLVILFINFGSQKRNFINKISKTNHIEIYTLDKGNFIFSKKISDYIIVAEFKDIFSDVIYANAPMMTSVPRYKLIFYDKENKKITEIKCISGIEIEDLNRKVTLNKEKYNSLNNLIKSVLND